MGAQAALELADALRLLRARRVGARAALESERGLDLVDPVA